MELENAKKSGMSVKTASKAAIIFKIRLPVPAAVPKNVDRVHLTRKVAKKLRNFKTSAISNSAFLVYLQRPGYTVPHPCVLTPPLRPKASVVRLAEAVRERGNFSTKAKANLMSWIPATNAVVRLDIWNVLKGRARSCPAQDIWSNTSKANVVQFVLDPWNTRPNRIRVHFAVNLTRLVKKST